MLVLLAACNGSSWIRDQIDSILTQEGVDVRVIISDDGSCDSTVEEIRRFRNDDRVKLSARSKPTGSAAQNFFALIRETPVGEHDFVALADQDDLWHPARLSRACRALRENNATGYSSSTLAFWPNGRTAVLRQAPTTTSADFLFEGAGQGCTFVLSAQLYDALRQFIAAHGALIEPLHYHDWTIYALARVWGHRWIFDPSPTVYYRQHTGNDTGAKLSVAGMRKRLALIKSGWYRRQILGITALCAAAAPTNSTVSGWRLRSETTAGWSRRIGRARFCITQGRRKLSDRLVLSLLTLLGWV